MSKYVPKAEWEKYQQILEDFIEQDAGTQIFKWLRYVNVPLPFGEDQGEIYLPIELEGLFQYNYIKVWPTTVNTVSGALDTTSITLFVTKNQLREKGFMNADDYWNFNNVSDRFIVNGKVYKPSGDTQLSQVANNPILIFVILDIVSPEEANKILKSYGNTKQP